MRLRPGQSIPSLAWAALFSILLAACNKEENLKRRVVLYPNGKNFKEEWTVKILPNGDTLMHGVSKEYFWGGSTKKSVVWKDGKRDGSAQAWYDNGGAKWQKSYDAGKKVGTWRLFYANGHPWMAINYQNDVMNGKVQVWDRDDAEAPVEAVFANGACNSGECGLLDQKPPAPNAPPPDKNQIRDKDIVQDFMD